MLTRGSRRRNQLLHSSCFHPTLARCCRCRCHRCRCRRCHRCCCRTRCTCRLAHLLSLPSPVSSSAPVDRPARYRYEQRAMSLDRLREPDRLPRFSVRRRRGQTTRVSRGSVTNYVEGFFPGSHPADRVHVLFPVRSLAFISRLVESSNCPPDRCRSPVPSRPHAPFRRSPDVRRCTRPRRCAGA